MRLSTSTNLMNFDRGLAYMVSFEHAISACAAAGYRYLDANFCGMSRLGKRFAPMTEDDWEQKAHAWRRLADDIGVRFCQGHAFFAIGAHVERGGVPGDDFGEEMMRRSVLAGEILGTEYLVVHPCSVYEGDTPLPTEEIIAQNVAFFGRWQRFFHAHGVGMAIENMPKSGAHPNVFWDMDNLIRLIDTIGQPDVGACLDTGHANLSGYDPADCVRTLGSRLRATHINDNHAAGKDEHLAPFQGNIDWPSVVRALREIGYDHDFAFEAQYLTAHFPLRVQGELLRFSYALGEYLLSEELFEDDAALEKWRG